MAESEKRDRDVTSLDDPDWVDKIVARAVENATSEAETDDETPSAVRERPTTRPAEPERAERRHEEPTVASPAKPRSERQQRSEARHGGEERAGAPSADDQPTAAPAARRQPEGAPSSPDAPVVAATETEGATGDDPHGWLSDSGEERTTAAGGATTALATVFDQDDGPTTAEAGEADATDDGESGVRTRATVEWIAVIVGAIVVAFLVRMFLLQAFYIPSGSMEPTLNVNDRVLVNKLAYDFHDVNRGDLVVFERPPGAPTDTSDLIKRVIALPTETVELIEGQVFISGRRLEESYIDGQQSNWLGFTAEARQLCGGDEICTVPEGHVFVMGDNRTGSVDSRSFGPIPEDSIVGRAFLRIWPLNDIGWL